jgi:hypothetical protein
MAQDLVNMTMDERITLQDERIEQARAQGLDEDTIRRAFPAATPRPLRDAAERKLADLRVTPTGPQFNEVERNSLEELAAILRGDTVAPDDSAKARSNRLPEPIKAAGQVYASEFRNTPVAELVDPENPEESVVRIVTTANDRDANIKGGVKEAVRRAHTPEEQALIYAEAAHMEQRSLQEQHKYRTQTLEMGQLKLFDQSRPGYLQGINDALGTNINNDLFALGAEFTPRTTLDFAQKTEALIKAGLLEDNVWTRVFGYGLASGASNQEAVENLAKLPPEEQVAAMKRFTKYYMESLPEELRSNFNGWMMMEDLFDENYINTGETDVRFKRWMLNFVGWMGAVELIPMASILTRPAGAGLRVLARSSVPLRLLQMQNPERYAAAMSRALNNMPDSAVQRTFNIGKIDIVETQMPHPGHLGDSIPNIPSNVADPTEIARVQGAAEAALDTARRLNSNAYTIPEQARIIDNVSNELQAAHAGRIRPNMSSVAVRDDMTGVDMQVMIGANDTTGFKSLDEAIQYGRSELQLQEMEYFRVKPNGVLEKITPTVTKDPETGLWVSKTKDPGEYYIRAKYEHTFMPEDAHLFDNNPPVVGTWMGRMMGFINTPSSFLDPGTVSKFTRSYLGEQALTGQLDSIVAPLYKQLNPQQRLAVNDTMLWAEEFGKEHGRLPNLEEVKSQFPRLSSQELQGFYTARYFQDTLWAIQNARLHNNWLGRGFRTATKPGSNTTYHGKPKTREDLKRDSINELLDPETGDTRKMTAEELDEFFERGGSVIRTDMAISGTKNNAHRHIMLDPESGWSHSALKKHVLEYIPGYNTRIYEDAHFIQRVNKGAKIDGKVEEHVSTVRTASTRAEAEAFRLRLMDGVGRRVMKGQWNKNWTMATKERELANHGFELRISQDARLSDADRIQVDLSKMQTEGRLFFDDRLNTPLKNVDKKAAEVVDPINSMQRVARMTSRQVATEDLIATQKMRFFDQYKELGINTRRTSSEIDADLSDIINQGGKREAGLAANARAEWRYIRFMEGSMVQGNTAFRRAAISSAEWLDHAIGAKIGARRVTRALSRRAHELSPVNAAKQLSFLHFITARPVRQLLLQGSQHFALQALDPTYAGKWQMDTFSLLGAMKRLARTREGDALYTMKRNSMGAMMGRSEDEMKTLLEEFQASGLIDGVDVHSYAGGLPKSSVVTPRSRVAQAGQAMVQTVQKPFHLARSMGFDLGEQFNVTASYLMALRRHMKERGLKKFTDLDADDWQKVANRGSHFALAMHKGNPAAWQYGFLSLPMQFLQFTHKWTLMSLNAVGARKTGLGNLQFTTGESQRIMIAQMLFWGGAGLGLKEPLRDIINSRDELNWMTQEQKEMLLSGAVDFGINEVLRNLMGDDELNFAFDEVFAPSMGMDMLAEKVMEVASEPMLLHELAMGPSGEVFSRLQKSVQFGMALTGKEFEHWNFTQKAGAVIEAGAAGLLSGYSDLLKIRLAARMGQWTNTAGTPLGLEAKWEELVMKGALGMNPQALLDYYRISGKAYDLNDEVKKDAKHHAETVSRIALQWGEGKLDDEQALAMFNKINVIYHEYKDAGYEELFYDEFINQFKRIRTPEGEGLLKWMTTKLLRGYTGDPVRDMLNSRAISQSEAERLQEWWDKAMIKQEENYETRTDLFERERELVRRLTNGE